VDAIEQFQMSIPESYRGQLTPVIEGMLKTLEKNKTAAGLNDQASYIESKLNTGDKKGF
jgi:hypothetical protein